MNNELFKTLLKENNYQSTERWYPISIEQYKNIFTLDSKIEGYHRLISNIAYNLQYLEFLEKELIELKLSAVISKMLIKTYTITAMSIMEGVFSNIIKSKGWWKTIDEESISKATAATLTKDRKSIVIKTEISEKIAPYDGKMSLDEMITCLARHHNGLKVDHLIYPVLKRLKDFRNRIHLQKGDAENDHDYNAFDFSVKAEVQDILYKVLSSPNVTDERYLYYYDFLKSG